MPYCTNCGKEIVGNVKFCSNCGAATPPPIPNVSYHIAINGQAAGPYDMNTLSQMALAGQLTSATLVWKNGMAQWSRADSVNELKILLANQMPPVPPTEN